MYKAHSEAKAILHSGLPTFRCSAFTLHIEYIDTLIQSPGCLVYYTTQWYWLFSDSGAPLCVDDADHSDHPSKDEITYEQLFYCWNKRRQVVHKVINAFSSVQKKCKRECGDMLHGNRGNSHGILALGSMYLAYNKPLIGKVHSFNTSNCTLYRNGETGEVGGVTHRVTWTWCLPGLAVKAPWLGWVGQFLPWLHEQA